MSCSSKERMRSLASQTHFPMQMEDVLDDLRHFYFLSGRVLTSSNFSAGYKPCFTYFSDFYPS